MMFVIPMAGESRRFRDACYTVPKYMLPLGTGFLFDHAVRSFATYFSTDEFLFVSRPDAVDFAKARCDALGITNSKFAIMDRATSGQAETVFLGLEQAQVPRDMQIAIFNIDTFRPGYRKPGFLTAAECEGYLEVFEGEGANWSFVAPDPSNPSRVAATAEKRAISNLCCTGLYYFRKTEDFLWAYGHPASPASDAERKERYVAPLYNALIARGKRIRFEIVARSEVIFCGTPEEYAQVQASDEVMIRLARDA
jgi:hypothetical protein